MDKAILKHLRVSYLLNPTAVSYLSQECSYVQYNYCISDWPNLGANIKFYHRLSTHAFITSSSLGHNQHAQCEGLGRLPCQSKEPRTVPSWLLISCESSKVTTS